MSYLKQSASNMSPQDRGRLQLGPPPLVGYSRTIPLSPVLTPHHPVLLAPPTSKLSMPPAPALCAHSRPTVSLLWRGAET